jgi:hypothetical protein
LHLAKLAILRAALQDAGQVCATDAANRSSELSLTGKVCLRSTERLTVTLLRRLSLL